MSGEDALRRARKLATIGDAEGVREAAAAPTERTPEQLAEWVLLLAAAGDGASARRLAATHPDAAFRARVDALLAAGDEPLPPDDGDELDVELRRTDERALDRRITELFLRWFGGRRDLYARQWHDEHRGRSGYRPVREPLTIAVARQHLAGRITIGQYLLGPDTNASFGVLDLDLNASALAELRASRGNASAPLDHPALRRYALSLLQAARALGLPLFAEDSGGRGLHLWLFFEPKRPARSARAVLSQVVAAAGGPPPEIGVEIFPKQDVNGPTGLSSLVKLPLGIHQATLRRCALLDDDLAPLDSIEQALARLRAADPDVIDAIAGRRLLALPAPELQAATAPPALPRVSSKRSLAEALRALGHGEDAKRAAQRMLDGCGVLAALVHKAHSARHLSADEGRAVAYTLGLVGDECAVADEALRAANASLKELDRVRRGLPSPMGCGKLQALDVASESCRGCTVPQSSVPYRTPTLLAIGHVAPAPPRHTPFAPWLGAQGPIVESPLETIGRSLERIEARLTELQSSTETAAPGTEEREERSP